MKPLFFSTVLILLFFSVNCQPTSNGMESLGNNSLQATSSNFYQINMVDRQGSTIKRNVLDQAIGNPFFIDEWQLATINTIDGKTYDNVSIKIHLQANEILYKKDSATIIIVDAGIIKQVIIRTLLDTTIFETGFLSINKNTDKTFYKVLSSGTYTFLCHIEKVFSTTKNEMSGEQTNEFKTYTNYFVVVNNQIKEISSRKPSKNLEELIQKTEEVKYNTYLNDHIIKSTKDLKELFDYLNK
jgi:hypothetical protein